MKTPTTPTTPLDFLRAVYPEGPFALTAISVDKKGIDTQTFMPNVSDDMRRLARWLTHHDGRSNLYWHVNPVIRPVTKKAEREDIDRVCFLHVDVDPPPANSPEELAMAQAKIKERLTNPPDGVPQPTFLVFSGGGYQAFWKLTDPIVLRGDLAKAEEAARYNKQLEVVFGADRCHNIDRLVRIPATWNIPDERKRKKGREKVRSEVVFWDPARVYPLSAFRPAPSSGCPGQTAEIPTNVPRIASVEDLNEWNVSDRLKVLVVQGHVPDETKERDNSRSAWLFDGICGLIRCKVPEGVIYSIITDPGLGISASVLDKGAGSEKYALRQIARAKQFVIHPQLLELNEKHAVIENMGGKCRVVEEVRDAQTGRKRLSPQSFEDFSNRYSNITVEDGVNAKGEPRHAPLGKWWLKHPLRRQFRTITFSPKHETPDNVYNLWQGFACEPREGDCSSYLAHVRDNICSGNRAYYDYLMGWMARCVQEPDTQGHTAVVLRGAQGTGKGFFAKTFGSLFGQHWLQVSNPEHLVGRFNGHLRDVVVLFGDEAFYAGDKRHESVLKTLVTEDSLILERKGIDAEAAPNFTHIIMASNSDWVVPAGADERRFFVLDVGDKCKQNTAYFGAIQKQMNNGGREALLFMLQNYDLTSFNVRTVPQTAALNDQKRLGLDSHEEWWYHKLGEGQLLPRGDGGWEEGVLVEDLMADYAAYAQRGRVMRPLNPTALGMFLHKVCPGIDKRRIGNKDRRPFYLFPPLEECLARWEERFGFRPPSNPEPEQHELFGE